MMSRLGTKRQSLFLCALLFFAPITLLAADFTFPGGSVSLDEASELATPLRLLIILTVLSLAPAFIVVLTSFTRIIIVLSMLRHAMGMPQTPPNVVLISLALFLTLFTMMPTFKQMNEQAIQPYLSKQISEDELLTKGLQPLRVFMVQQTRETDIALILELGNAPQPDTLEDISTFHLAPAFMLSELRTAFEIGFIVFLPFVLIDIIVASTLMSLGMIMVPPLALSLPLKVLLFVLIDGWHLLVQSLVASFAV